MSAISVTLDDARRTQRAIADVVVRTPIIACDWLQRRLGVPVWLKCENLQRTGSFKLRGAFAAVRRGRPTSVVAASAGNHGQALALAAARIGVPCTIVVPRNVPKVKADAIVARGARLAMPPEDWPDAHGYDGAESYMNQHFGRRGAVIVSAFEDPDVVAGNGGTLALEAIEQVPEIRTFVVPCGGGGCVGGIGVVARDLRSGMRVFGVNTSASPGMWRSFRDQRAHLSVPDGLPTIADGIEGGVRYSSFELCRRVVDGIVLAREQTIARCVGMLALRERLVVEGAGSAAVAAVLDGVVPVDGEPVCIVLTGGNVDGARLATLLAGA